jgi:hypothetical protein
MTSQLSILNFVRLVRDVIGEDLLEKFFMEVSRYDLVVSKILQGRVGIDTPLCIKLIHISIQFVESMIFFPLPEISRKSTEHIYRLVYMHYARACKNLNFRSTPNIAGFERAVKSFNKRKESKA